ncbi:MAG: hypothetical protein IT460_13505 [Planctomycetes bacterium]|nr:hypothetical protein [Planctomycetota bacterium]
MNGIVPTGGFDPGGPWINRWVLRGTLTTRSPLHVGSGRSLDFIDACTERDASGRPVVPGSGLRGTIRARLLAACGEDASLLKRVFGLFGPEAEEGDDDGLVSGKVRFEDARARPVPQGEIPGIPPDATPHYDPERGTYVVTSVALDPDTGTASDRKLYTVEVVPTGTTFDVRIVLSNVLDEEVGLVVWALDRFNDDGAALTLGADAGRGFGLVRWTRSSLSRIGPCATAGMTLDDAFANRRREAWRAAATASSAHAHGRVGLENVTGEDVTGDAPSLCDAAAQSMSVACDDEPVHVQVAYQWTASAPLLIREGTKLSKNAEGHSSFSMSVGQGKRRGEHFDVAGPDRDPNEGEGAELRGPALQAFIDADGPRARFEIPGSAMRGVLRSYLLQRELPPGDRALDSASAVPDAAEPARAKLVSLFGTTERQGRIEFSHAVPEAPDGAVGSSIRYEDRSCPGPEGLVSPPLRVEVRGPVDRITSGARVGGLHQVATIEAGAAFVGSVVVRDAAESDIATLLAWKRGFDASALSVGGATAVGFGQGTLCVTRVCVVGARSGRPIATLESSESAQAFSAGHARAIALVRALAPLFSTAPRRDVGSPAVAAALAAPTGRPLPPMAGDGSYMNPYDFVRFPRTVAGREYASPRTALAREWEARGPLVSGTLVVELTALQPILVVGRTDPAPAGTDRFGRWRFTRDAAGPRIPGATLRGVLRSYVEARWNGWVSTYSSNAMTPDEWMHAGPRADEGSNPYARKHGRRYGGFNSDTAWRDHSPNGGWKAPTPSAIPPPFLPAWACREGILHQPIDVASFLFGAVLRPEPGTPEEHRAEPSLRGRVRLSDCRIDERMLTTGLSVPDLEGDPFLGGPKPSKSTLFYFRPGTVRARHTTTPGNHALEIAQFEGGEFRGRKFYFHQDATRCVASYVTADDPRNRWRLGSPAGSVYARPVEALAVGNGGRFRVHLDRVPLPLVALLLRALEPTDSVRHKLGYAKPFGFGSVALAVAALETDARGVTLDTVRALATTLDAEGWGFACESAAWSSIDRDLRYVLTYDAASVSTILFTYPPYGPGQPTDAARGFATPHQLGVLAPLPTPRPATADDVRRFATAQDGHRRPRKTALDLGYWQRQSPFFRLVCHRAQRQGESPPLDRTIHPEYAAP